MSRSSNLDYLRGVLGGTISPTDKSPFNFPFPIMKSLGLRLVEISEETASYEMEAKTDLHSNPMGTIHGGVLCDIADAAIGTALSRLLQMGRASRVSICRSISFDRFGTKDLKRSLNLSIEEERSAATFATSQEPTES